MKILIVTADFYPTISPRSFRATELANYYSKMGHDVSVMTPIYPDSNGSYGGMNYRKIDLGKNILETNYCSPIVKYVKKSINKILRLVRADYAFDLPSSLFFFNVFFKIFRVGHCDLIISIAQPHSVHWGVAAAVAIAPNRTKFWIADCGDPYSGNPFNKVPAYFKIIENISFRIADIISVPTQEAIAAYSTEFINKIAVIPQAFDIEKDKKHVKKYIGNPVPTFGYAGNFYAGLRDPSELFEYLTNLDIDYRFYVFTSKPDLYYLWTKKSNGKIIFKDRIPRNNIISIFSTFDFLVNINNYGNVQTPSKLIDYKIIGRPVISLDGKGLNEKLLESYLLGDYEESDKLMDFDISKYEISNVANQFVNLYKKAKPK